MRGESLIKIPRRNAQQSQELIITNESLLEEDKNHKEQEEASFQIPGISTQTGSRKKPMWERGSKIEYPISPKAGR